MDFHDWPLNLDPGQATWKSKMGAACMGSVFSLVSSALSFALHNMGTSSYVPIACLITAACRKCTCCCSVLRSSSRGHACATISLIVEILLLALSSKHVATKRQMKGLDVIPSFAASWTISRVILQRDGLPEPLFWLLFLPLSP